VVIYKNIQSFGLLNRIVSLLFAIEIISAFIIVNTSNTIILPKGYEWGLLSKDTVYGYFYCFAIDRTW
jgi:hypothetical protein